MGTLDSSSNEWIELKNLSDSLVSLSGWQILDKDNQIKIVFDSEAVIPSQGFYLLERTDDSSVPNISADYIYTGILNDNNEVLYLFDNNCQLQDIIIAEPDWPAGSKQEKRTMERGKEAWHTYSGIGQNNILGTPKAENSLISQEPEEPLLSLLITEAQISGLNDEKQEFVEIYNQSENDIDLTGWYMQRKTKSGQNFTSFVPKSLFENKIIKSGEYFLIAREDSDFSEISDVIVNKPLTEDNVLVLKNAQGLVVDKLGWGKAQDYETEPADNPLAGKSLSRKWNQSDEAVFSYIDTDNNKSDFEISEPSPKRKNNQNLPEPPASSSIVWQNFQHDVYHTGRSDYEVVLEPKIEWISDFNLIDSNCRIAIAGPVIDSKSVIYFGLSLSDCEQSGHKIYALNKDGSLKWQFQELEAVFNYLSLGYDNTLYISTNKGVYALDTNNGTLKWIFYNPDIIPSSSVTADADNICYTGYKDIVCLNPDGTEKWKAQGIRRGGTVSQGPVISSEDNTIYAVWTGFRTPQDQEYGYLIAYDLETGEQKWNYRLQRGRAQAPCLDINNKSLYLTAGESGYFGTFRYLYAFSLEDKGLKWTKRPNTYGSIITPVISSKGDIIITDNWEEVAGESWGVYVWQPYSQITVFSPQGEIIWTTDKTENSRIENQPIIDKNGNLIILETEYEKQHWGGLFGTWGFRPIGRKLKIIDIYNNGEIKSEIDVYQIEQIYSIIIGPEGRIYFLTRESDADNPDFKKIKIYSLGREGISWEEFRDQEKAPQSLNESKEEITIEEEIDFVFQEIIDLDSELDLELDFDLEDEEFKSEEENLEEITKDFFDNNINNNDSEKDLKEIEPFVSNNNSLQSEQEDLPGVDNFTKIENRIEEPLKDENEENSENKNKEKQQKEEENEIEIKTSDIPEEIRNNSEKENEPEIKDDSEIIDNQAQKEENNQTEIENIEELENIESNLNNLKLKTETEQEQLDKKKGQELSSNRTNEKELKEQVFKKLNKEKGGKKVEKK